MAVIRVLAFEDDDLHADILKMHLHNLGYQNAGIYPDASDAARLISAISPDIILMDIDLAGETTGIQAAQKLNAIFNIPLIYLTSISPGTIISEVKATFPEAYLRKPYTEDQLSSAIEIAIHKYQRELQSPKYRDSFQQSDFLYVKVNNNLVKLQYSDIHYIEAYDKYCFIHTADKKHMVTGQLKQLLQKLPARLFLQVHRSYAINMNAISGIRTNQNTVEIGSVLIPYSKTYKDELYSRLNVI